MNKDIRWRQRFDNFEKAFEQLRVAIEIDKPSVTERAGLIQFFEMTFELSWKVLKDYLEVEGFEVKSPRETIKQAFQAELITDGQVWLEALGDRNLMTHTYDEKASLSVEALIRNKYYPILQSFFNDFKNRV